MWKDNWMSGGLTDLSIDMLSTCEHSFRVAGFWMSVRLPESWDVVALLPSFRPFMHEMCGEGIRLFDCVVRPASDIRPVEHQGVLIDETVNDMGSIRLFSNSGGYRVELSVEQQRGTHLMQASRDFSEISVQLCTGDNEAGRMLSSLLRIAYSQAVLRHDSLAIHASSVYVDERGYLFLGKSGTGKSTHSSLWMRHIPGARLLNDDNPTVRIIDGKAYVCGTPWSGKTPCYVDRIFPIGGMVRLNQASENRFCIQEGADAFVALFPGCSAICWDEVLRSHLYDTVARLADMVPVGLLDCRPDEEAVLLCSRALCDTYAAMENQQTDAVLN